MFPKFQNFRVITSFTLVFFSNDLSLLMFNHPQGGSNSQPQD